MNSFFSMEGPFQTFMTLVFDIFILNILWILCSLPLFTIGASTTALYTVMLKRARNNEGYIIKGFFRAFKENFKQSLPLALLFWGIAVVLFLDYLIMSRWENGAVSIVLGIIIFGAAALIAVFGYVWPLMAKFENTRMNILANAAKLSVGMLPRTLLMVLLNGLPLFFFFFVPALFLAMMWFYLVFGFGLTAYLISKLLNPVFDRFT